MQTKSAEPKVQHFKPSPKRTLFTVTREPPPPHTHRHQAKQKVTKITNLSTARCALILEQTRGVVRRSWGCSGRWHGVEGLVMVLVVASEAQPLE